MNILDLQDKLKNLSEQQLVREMQMPTGQMPQFLVLSEITRRKKMRDAFAQEQMKDGTTTVAQDVVAAAGMPAGFAGQMAGAMAPKTDMGMNSGVMPQQSAMPAPAQPVQGMAGGGIVALQEGGRVSNTPELVVRGGRQYARMPDGSLIPLSELGFDEAELSGAGTADLTAPSSSVRQGPIPSQSDLDRRFRDESVGISGLPPALSEYGAGSMDAVIPGAESPVLRGGGDAVGLARVLSTTGGLASPDMEAARSYPPRVQGPARLPRQPLAPDTFVEDFGYNAEPAAPRAPRAPQDIPLNAMEQLYADEQARRGPPSRRPEVTIREDVTPIDWESFFFPLRGTPGANIPEYDRELYSLDPEVSAEAQDVPVPAVDVQAPTDDTVRPEARPEGAMVDTGGAGTRGGAGGDGGGIAAVAKSAPSDFEQELLNMLAAREKRAVQDKWLALAQAGMALMSSKAPTFGEALGEAGAAGLGALREGQSGAEADRLALLGQLEQSRMGREELAIRRQAAAARGSGSDGLRAKDYITLLMNAEKAAREEATALAPTGVPAPAVASQYEDAVARANALRAQYGTLLGVPVGGSIAPERLK